MLPRTVAFLFAVLALISVGCDSEQADSSPVAKGPPTAKISIAKITESTLEEDRRFLGEVRSAQSTSLAAGGAGEVLRVLVAEGDRVKKGQTLVQLDDGILRARLDEFQAGVSRSDVELGQVQRDTERLQSLSGKGYFPSAEVEQIQSRKEALRASRQGQDAAVRRLREEISQMRITAPFEGTVARRHVSPGQWIQPGQPAIEMASDGQREVHVRVPGTLLDLITKDAKVQIVSGPKSVAGEVAGVVGALDPRTRTALVRVVPEMAPDWLMEGTAVDVSMRLKRPEAGVVIPLDAIVYGVAGTRVFLVAEDKANPVNVTIITQVGDRVLVQGEGLEVGQTVITKGNERLRPGQALQVVE